MNSHLRVIWFQELPRYAKRWFSCFKPRRKRPISFIENIDHFEPATPKTKNALIALLPAAWSDALREYPHIRFFNTVGLTYELVRALNNNGYLVDMIDYREDNFQPLKKYDLFIGHGGHCSSLVDRLEENRTIVLQYVSGAYWKEFLRQSRERYDRVFLRSGIPPTTSYVRSFNDAEIEGEQYLTEHAKYLFTGNYPRMIKAYGEYAKKIQTVGWTAYIEEDLIVKDRDYDKGRKGFIYVAGTGGNIQKGLDLILETFARSPALHLYIYCNVEKEVRKLYRKELSLPNIHYIYHYRFGSLRTHLRTLLKKVNFTITAPIDTGLGTAFLGSLGLGLIPVGYADMPCSSADSHLTNSWQVESLVENVREASLMPVEWCQQASELIRQNVRDNWSTQAFQNRFSELIQHCSEEAPGRNARS